MLWGARRVALARLVAGNRARGVLLFGEFQDVVARAVRSMCVRAAGSNSVGAMGEQRARAGEDGRVVVMVVVMLLAPADAAMGHGLE